MNFEALTSILNRMYFNAPDGEAVAMIHLFGIKYAKDIQCCNESMKKFAISSGLSASFGTEISKGVKLAKYVSLKT